MKFRQPLQNLSEKSKNFLLKHSNWYKNSKSLFSFLLSLWTSWKQFRQHRRKNSVEKPKLFGSMSENYLKYSFFSEKNVFFKVFLWKRRMEFWRHRRNFSDKRPKIFVSMCDNEYKIHFFQKAYFSSNCSSGHVECSFLNSGNTLSKTPKTVCSVSQNGQKYVRSSKNCFSSNCSSGHVDCSFRNPSENVSKKTINFMLSVANWWKIHKFFTKLFFLKLFLWTSRMQFWQPLRENFEKKAKKFLLKVR